MEDETHPEPEGVGKDDDTLRRHASGRQRGRISVSTAVSGAALISAALPSSRTALPSSRRRFPHFGGDDGGLGGDNGSALTRQNGALPDGDGGLGGDDGDSRISVAPHAQGNWRRSAVSLLLTLSLSLDLRPRLKQRRQGWR